MQVSNGVDLLVLVEILQGLLTASIGVYLTPIDHPDLCGVLHIAAQSI
jgi:hypothetical protein